MILPTKGISPDRSLLGIGSDVLELLQAPMTVSQLWHAYRKLRTNAELQSTVTFDWFVLALDFLYTTGAIGFNNSGRLEQSHVS